MKKEIIDCHEGVVTEIHYNPSDERWVKNRWQHTDGIISNNKNKKVNNLIDKKDHIYLKADVPVTVIEQWSKELGDNCLKRQYRDFLHKKLNDPDNEMWLTTKGKMGKRISWR